MIHVLNRVEYFTGRFQSNIVTLAFEQVKE